jgi:hypothetical protein
MILDSEKITSPGGNLLSGKLSDLYAACQDGYSFIQEYLASSAKNA